MGRIWEEGGEGEGERVGENGGREGRGWAKRVDGREQKIEGNRVRED